MNVFTIVKTHDESGNYVKGHLSRVKALFDAIKEVSEEECTLFYLNEIDRDYFGNNSILIVDDGEVRFDLTVDMPCIVITDQKKVINYGEYPISIINGSSLDTAISGLLNQDVTVHIGLQASIISPLTRRYQYSGYESEDVLVISGGAPKAFSSIMVSLDIDNLIGLAELRTVFANNVSREEILSMACKSKFVVCTPSVISLEMIAMGVPFMSLLTAPDQIEYANIYYHVGIPTDRTSDEGLMSFIANPVSPPMIINRNHVYKLANELCNLTNKDDK